MIGVHAGFAYGGSKATNLLQHPGLVVARAGTAGTYIDANGALQTAAANTLRYDYSNPNGAGWLIEASRTNLLRNNTMAGASVPATLPNFWVNSTAGGLTTTVIGVGTANGFSYIDLRISGTPSGTFYATYFDSTTQVVATAADVWTGSAYIALVAGSLTNMTFRSTVVARTAAGDFVAQQTATHVPDATLTRYSNTYTMPALAERIQYGIVPVLTIGAAVDATFRIAVPHLSLAGNLHSVILTSSTAVTRPADNVSMLLAGLPQWNASEGTFLIDFVAGPSVVSKYLLDINDGTTNNRIRVLTTSGGNPYLLVTTGGVVQATIAATAALVASTRNKVAVSFKTNNFNLALNGTLATPDTSGTMPVVDRVQFGADRSLTASTFLDGHLTNTSYRPTALGAAMTSL